MKKQLQQQLLESKAPRQIDDMSMQQQLFSGQTMKTGESPAMQVGDLDKSAKRASAARTTSDATAGFPSAQSKDVKNKNSNKPSGFDNQDKDSEDAESFDEEKQKTQVLNDLKMMMDSDGDDDDDDKEPDKPIT